MVLLPFYTILYLFIVDRWYTLPKINIDLAMSRGIRLHL